MIMSFSRKDENKNAWGVKITPENPTPRHILKISKAYAALGWDPNARTKKAIEKAKSEIKQNAKR